MSDEPTFLPSFQMDLRGNLRRSSCLNMNALKKDAPMPKQVVTVLQVSPEDQVALVEAILNPPPINEAMKRAFERADTLFGKVTGE